MSWTPPAELEEYRIVRPLGAGTMGQVFLAHDQLLDRAVAIKFVGSGEVESGARERFFVEARAVARLSHPNVVAIYRVGELRRRPYLVSELVRGSSLAELPKPVPWERVLKLGIGLARGLGAAHRRGVLHRDIKPANAMVTDEGEAKLLDFGLAKLVDLGESGFVPPAAFPVVGADGAIDATASLVGASPRTSAGRGDRPAPNPLLTAAGALVGTPLYLAPELWAGARATERSDVYSLGVVLYELLTGRAPHAGLAIAELADAVTSTDVPPIAGLAPGLPARLAALIDACTSRDPTRRPDSGDALCELLETVLPAAAVAVEGSPYRGLATFEPQHRGLFFGRAEETRAVVERLRTETLVIVAGDSGTGKSSLCRAAVLPTIDDKAQSGRRWQTATMVPGTRPRAALEAVLATRLAGEGLLLFVDQLEELLTIADPDEAAWVADTLAELVTASSDTRVLASARSDFLGRLAALPGLGELIGRALYLLGPLGERGLREAIVRPARALGYEFESAVTVEELVTSGRRHLPLLQFTLAELWDARDDRAHRIPADALDRIGGVAGALARRADQVLAALGDGDRTIAWQVLVRLMTAEGTRNVLTRAELAETAGDRAAVERVVERLVVARLLVVAADGDDRVEVVHEALFTGWPRLVAWRREHDEGVRMRDQLAEAARRWQTRGRPRGLLWRGDALAEYVRWRLRWTERPTGVEAEFGAACVAARRRERRVRVGLVAAVIAILASGLVVLYRSDRRASAERDRAEARRIEVELQRRSLYEARGIEEQSAGHPARALPYLLEALREGDESEALRVLIGESTRPLALDVMTNRDFVGGVAPAVWSPDGSQFVAIGNEPIVRLYDRTGRRLRELPTTDPAIARAVFSRDGTRLFVGSSTSALYAWDLTTGVLLYRREGNGGELNNLDIDHDDGRILLVSRGGGRIFDARTGALLSELPPLGCARFSPDGSTVYAMEIAGALAAVSATDGRVLRRADLPVSSDCELRVSPDGSRVVSSDPELVLWDAASLTRITLPELLAPAPIDISPDGAHFVTGTADGVVRIWGTERGTLERQILGHIGGTKVLHYSANGTRLVTVGFDRSIRVWNAMTGASELSFDAGVSSPTSGSSEVSDVVWSPDGTLLLVACGREVVLHRVARDSLVHEIVSQAEPSSARLSPDETLVALAGLKGELEVWNLATEQRVFALHAGPRLWDVGWNHDGSELVIAGVDGLAEIRSARDGVVVHQLLGHAAGTGVYRATYSPDGDRIVTAGSDGTARIFDAATAAPQLVLRHAGAVMSATWNHEGSQIATGLANGSVVIWNAITGAQIVDLHDATLKFLDVGFSPDDTRVVATSRVGVVTVWDLATHQRVLDIVGHTGPVAAGVWSANGALIVTASSDGTARIWDVATGRQLASRTMDREALQVTWNRAGTHIVVASERPGVRIWDVSPDRRSLAELDAFAEQHSPYQLVEGRLESRELQ